MSWKCWLIEKVLLRDVEAFQAADVVPDAEVDVREGVGPPPEGLETPDPGTVSLFTEIDEKMSPWVKKIGVIFCKLDRFIIVNKICKCSQTSEFTPLYSWGPFVEQKLMLSSSFKCDQNYKYERYYFGHTLLCFLSPTSMFNKPTTEVYTINLLTNIINFAG